MAFKEEGTKRECYEGSPALDITKLEQQYELVQNGSIKCPIYYVYWLDIPCVKGIFYIEIEDVYKFYKENATIFERKVREGDYTGNTNKLTDKLKKIHISIYQMGEFSDLITKLGG